MDEQQMRERLAELNDRIANYPYWGAALTAMDEERRGLQRALGSATSRPAAPSAD